MEAAPNAKLEWDALYFSALKCSLEIMHLSTFSVKKALVSDLFRDWKFTEAIPPLSDNSHCTFHDKVGSRFSALRSIQQTPLSLAPILH